MTYKEKVALRKAFNDIPGTYVLTPEHSQKGYGLNMFCMSLNKEESRAKFRENEAEYLKGYKLTDEQRDAILSRDYLRCLQLGGNIYYVFKIAIFDRRSMQYVGGKMSGVTEEEFRDMMLSGGRSIIGNRSKEEKNG